MVLFFSHYCVGIMLHRLITSDPKEELSDKSRWMKLEPADVVVECVSYDMENSPNSSNGLENFTKIALEEADSVITEKKIAKARRPLQAISMQEIMEVHQGSGPGRVSKFGQCRPLHQALKSGLGKVYIYLMYFDSDQFFFY